MRKSKFSEKQIIEILKEIDVIGTGSTNQHLKYIANIMKFKQKI